MGVDELQLTVEFTLIGFSWWKSPDEAFLGGGRLFLPGPWGSVSQFLPLQGADFCEATTQHHVWWVGTTAILLETIRNINVLTAV